MPEFVATKYVGSVGGETFPGILTEVLILAVFKLLATYCTSNTFPFKNVTFKSLYT
jgi:hypothetical protein